MQSVTYVPLQTYQPSRAKRHRLKWSKRMIRKHQLNRIKCVDEEAQARLNAEVAAKGSFDAGVAAAAAGFRSYGEPTAAGAFSTGAGAFGGGAAVAPKGSGKKSKPEKVKKPKKKINKRALAIVAIILAVLIGVSAVGFGTYAALAHFVFFPDADDALENALEPKLDLGTKFDLSDLLDRGRIELYASDLSEIGLNSNKFASTLTYTKDAADLYASLGGQNFHLVYNDKGVAFNAEKFDSDTYYGFATDGLAAALEDSFLDPDSDSENALSESEFESLLETVRDLEAIRENEGKYEDAADRVLGAIGDAFEASTLSQCETNYGGLVVFGAQRSARSRIYSFDNGDLVDFANKLSATFAQPDAKLLEAVELLLSVDEFRLGLEDTLGTGVEDCDDLALAFEDIAELLEASGDDWSAKLVLAYAGRAFTAIQLRVVTPDAETLAVVDFGENPSRDKTLKISVESSDNHGAVRVFSLDYGVEKVDGKSVASLVLGTEERDDLYGDYDKTSYRFALTFDGGAGRASLKATEETEYLFGGDEPIKDSSDMFEIMFKLEDKLTSLSLELDGARDAFGDEMEVGGSYKLTFSKFYGWVKLPEYKSVLTMDADDYDELYSDYSDYIAEFRTDYVGNVDLGEIFPDIDLPSVVFPEIDLPSGDSTGGNRPSGSNTAIDSGSYVYEDGTGYKDVYFFNNGSYSYKSYSGEQLLLEERGTYEAYSGYIVFYPSDAEEYELSIDEVGENGMVLDGISYYRQ